MRIRRTGPRKLTAAGTGLPVDVVALVNDVWANPDQAAARRGEALGGVYEEAYRAGKSAVWSVNLSSWTEHAHGQSSWLCDWDSSRVVRVVLALADRYPTAVGTPRFFEAVWRVFSHVHGQHLFTGRCTRTQVAAVVAAVVDATTAVLDVRAAHRV